MEELNLWSSFLYSEQHQKLTTMKMNIFKLHIIILANLKNNNVKKFGDFHEKHFKHVMTLLNYGVGEDS